MGSLQPSSENNKIQLIQSKIIKANKCQWEKRGNQRSFKKAKKLLNNSISWVAEDQIFYCTK